MANILLAEDDELARYAIAKVLRKAGHSVREAVNGSMAFDMVAQELPDLLITDVVMPDCDGLSLLTDLRKQHSTLPVLVISGGGSNVGGDYLFFAERLGASAILKKPFSNDDLLARIDQLLPPGTLHGQ